MVSDRDFESSFSSGEFPDVPNCLKIALSSSCLFVTIVNRAATLSLIKHQPQVVKCIWSHQSFLHATVQISFCEHAAFLRVRSSYRLSLDAFEVLFDQMFALGIMVEGK